MFVFIYFRTNEVGCESDMEFLAKVHCVRQASEVWFVFIFFSDSKFDQLYDMSTMGFLEVLSSIFKLFFSDPLCLFFFKMVFLSSETRQWFIDAGRQALSAVIESAGKVKYWVQTLAFDCMNIFLWLLTISVADIS